MKKMKRILLLSLILAALVSCFALQASAVEAASGTCGSNLYWVLDTAGNLTISGSGSMNNYNRVGNCGSDAPWYSRNADIKTVYIGDGVTHIGNWAFAGLQNMTGVTIGSKVTSIGDCAFFESKSLPEVTIPDNVTTLGYSIFNFCSGLTKVNIGSGIRSITFSVFENCSGLTRVTIPDNVTTIENYTFSGCTSLQEVVLGKGVSYIGYESFSFCYDLSHIFCSGNAPTIQYDSFYNAEDVTFYYIPGTTGWDSSTWDSYALATWTGTPSVPVTPRLSIDIRYNNVWFDVLDQWVTINGDSGVGITVRANLTGGSGNEKLYLSQNTTHSVELPNGSDHSFVPTQHFEADKNLYVLVVDEVTGEAYSVPVKLKIIKKETDDGGSPEGPGGLNFKLGNEIGFNLPSNVPCFNDAEIKWNFDFIPVSFEYDREDSNKINVVFGINVASSDGKEDKYFKDFDFKEYKEAFKEASKLKRTTKQLRGYFKNSKKCKMNLFGGKVLGGGSGEPSFDMTVSGYAEAKMINGQMQFIEGQLMLFIWAVPVYYEIGGGVGAGFEGNVINLLPDTFEPQLEGYLTAKLKANLGAGIGVAKVATVGVGGEGSLNLKSGLHTKYLKCWGEGNANINVKVLGKTVAKSDFLKGDFLIYETGNANGLIKDNAVQLQSVGENYYAAVNPDAVYENESRAYAAQPALWYENSIRLMDMAYTNEDLQLLAENTYTESAPMLCEIGGKKVLVMLWDDENRTDANRTMLVWSVYDEISGWSAPQPVHDDGTADFYPNFKDGYVVWQNEKSALTDDMTLAEIAALGEIYLAKWNGSGFDTPVAITDNDTLDTLPAVCAEGETVTVSWVNNDQNDILGLSGTNAVQKMTLGGSTEALYSGSAPVTAHAAGNGHVAFALDEDGDLQTTEDWELYLDGSRLTENEVLDSNPVFAGGKLYYYTGGNIAIYDLAEGTTEFAAEEAVPGLTDGFAVSVKGENAAIWWAGSAEGGAEIFGLLKKDGAWTTTLPLTDMEYPCRYPTGVLEEDGSMTVAFCHSRWEEDLIAQNDLYILQLTPACNLAVEDLYADEQDMVVYATVRNKGQLNVDSYTIWLKDEKTNNKLTVEDPLKAGEAMEVELPYVVPADMTRREVTFEVTADTDEFDTTDNTARITLGHSDLEVKNAVVTESRPISETTVTLSNTGYAAAEQITVALRQGSADGEILAEQAVASLSAGESREITFQYDVTQCTDTVFYVTVSTETTERTTANNDLWFTNAMIGAAYEGSLSDIAVSESGLTVQATVSNCTEEAADLLAAIAVFRSNGQMKAMDLQTITAEAEGDGTCDFRFADYVQETGDYVKLFVMDGDKRPLITVTADDVYLVP